MANRPKIIDPRYARIMMALREIAGELDVIMFRPNYHGKNGDKNTVLFYTKEDNEHNSLVDAQFVQYSASEAENLSRKQGCPVDDKFVYRNPFWTFENSDANGMLNYNFANHGKIQLQNYNVKDTLKPIIKTALETHKMASSARLSPDSDVNPAP